MVATTISLLGAVTRRRERRISAQRRVAHGQRDSSRSAPSRVRSCQITPTNTDCRRLDAVARLACPRGTSAPAGADSQLTPAGRAIAHSLLLSLAVVRVLADNV